jgi:hypothetical protein
LLGLAPAAPCGPPWLWEGRIEGSKDWLRMAVWGRGSVVEE